MATYNYGTHGLPGLGQPYGSHCTLPSRALAIREARLSYDEEYGLKRGIVFKFWTNDGTVKFEHTVHKLSMPRSRRREKCITCGKGKVVRRNRCWSCYKRLVEDENELFISA